MPQQNHNFNGITDMCAGLLDGNSRQSCIFVSQTPSLKHIVKASEQCFYLITGISKKVEQILITSLWGFLKVLRLDLHKQTETNDRTSILKKIWDHFSSITCHLTELREEPKNSNSSLTYPLHETMLPPI